MASPLPMKSVVHHRGAGLSSIVAPQNGLFPGLLTILVYPLWYMVEAKRQIGEHLWEEGTMNRLGETGRRMGSLVLVVGCCQT